MIDFFIKRPIFAGVIAILMALGGYIALRVLPVVRVLRFDPPRGTGVAPMELEDFATGLVRSGTARTLTDLLPELWSVRMSRSG